MGKKYIIEFEDEPFKQIDKNNNVRLLWNAKGFASLVFDDYGLKKLQPYEEVKTAISLYDEVTEDGETWLVTRVDGIGINGIDTEGYTYYSDIYEVTKTGRHFSGVDDYLRSNIIPF